METTGCDPVAVRDFVIIPSAEAFVVSGDTSYQAHTAGAIAVDRTTNYVRYDTKMGFGTYYTAPDFACLITLPRNTRLQPQFITPSRVKLWCE